MKQVKVIGVPEHFNYPWHLAIEDGAFEERGIDLVWEDIPEGTGRMAKLLADGDADLAIILTEGIVKSISEGNPSKIVQVYVESPLQWGIHVDGKSKLGSIGDLKGKIAAISRFGSGSHLMAHVNAENQGWDTSELKFEVVNNLENAVNALGSNKADYFMWEHFTTKPLVDNGTFKRLGDCPTPWPCFVIAGNEKFLLENGTLLNHILAIINTYTAEFKMIPSIDRSISNRYGQKVNDVQDWLSMTSWSQEPLTEEETQRVQEKLFHLKLISEISAATSYLF